jgi:hypothetical protein
VMGKIDLSALEATDGVLRQHLEDSAAKARTEDALRRLAGRTTVRPKDAREAGLLNTQDAEVRIRRNPQNADEFEVAVYSLMRPGNFRRVLLHKYSPTAAVQIAAGACCEELCEQNRDPFDPSQAAQDAARLFEAFRRDPSRVHSSRD